MEDVTKKYICKLPTNGNEVGDEVFLTEAEVASANGGEAEPRYVLASEYEAPPEPVPAPEPQSYVANAPETVGPESITEQDQSVSVAPAPETPAPEPAPEAPATPIGEMSKSDPLPPDAPAQQ